MRQLGLADRVREQARHCAHAGSPLTAALLSGAADDLDAGGPTADLLGPLAGDPPGSVPALRFAGALHRLVLERRAPGLAVHYPSVGGTPGEVWPAARRVVAEQLAALRPLVARPVQTNEVGRCAALAGGLMAVTAEHGLPVRLLEVGASAGLNLHVDRYAYEVDDDTVLGDPSSAVRLVRPWQGRPAAYDVPLRLVERRGCDPQPLDPGSAEDRLTLTSYVWADQVERFERLRGALRVATAHGVRVERRSAASWLQAALAQPVPGAVTVVWHSVVRQYLSDDERARLAAVLEHAAARATPAAPLAHLSLEPEQVGAEVFAFRVELTTWPGGTARVLADAEGHGPPVRWRA